jgi:starch synthase
MDYTNLMKLAIDFSDGIIQGSEKIDPVVAAYVQQQKVEFLPYEADPDKSAEAIDAFYEKIDA